jgi:hypothetical protein
VPDASLETGLRPTYTWIAEQVQRSHALNTRQAAE